MATQSFSSNVKIVFITAIIILSQFRISFSQRPANYNDVVVIINSADTTSVNIGNYFKTKRNIRTKNIISIPMPLQEEIDNTQFETIRAAIEDTMIARNLVTTTNYLVTTKGVPLKICREADCTTTSLGGYTNSAGFDSELMLILGPKSFMINNIGSCGLQLSTTSTLNHSYYLKGTYFDSQKYGMYLATRLTAWTQQQVYALIDSSGPNIKIDKTKVKIVLDAPPASNSNVGTGWNQYLALTKTNLTTLGYTNIVFDTSNNYIRGQSNVFLYWGWGHAQSGINRTNAAPGNTWCKGSAGCVNDYYTARSFSDSTGTGGFYNAMIADWIREGATAMSGPVYNSYNDVWTFPYSFFGYYTNPNYCYNLAESFYMASPSFSWHFVAVGDPKTSIYYAPPPVPNPTVNTYSTSVCIGTYLKLTASNNFAGTVNWFNADTNTVKAAGPLYDFTHPNWVATGTTYTVSTNTAGIYKYSYINENISGIGIKQITVNVGCLGIAENNSIKHLEIYPNPTNGEVNIDIELDKESDMKISTIDMLGKIMQEKNYKGNAFTEKMNLSGLTKGVYFIEIQVDEQKLYYKLLLQ